MRKDAVFMMPGIVTQALIFGHGSGRVWAGVWRWLEALREQEQTQVQTRKRSYERWTSVYESLTSVYVNFSLRFI